jgi:hypothetical protein
MAYKITLPQKMMKELWMLRESLGGPSIIQACRESIADYIKRKETEIGTSIEDAAEAVERHRHERNGNRA